MLITALIITERKKEPKRNNLNAQHKGSGKLQYIHMMEHCGVI